MVIPVVRMDRCVLHRFPAVDHHPVPDIDPDMACADSVISPLKEDDVSWLRLFRRNISADLPDLFRRQPAVVPAVPAVVDDPADKAGTVKSARCIAAPDVRRTQMLFRFLDHPCKPLIAECFRRDGVTVPSIGRQAVQIEEIVPVPEGPVVQAVSYLLVVRHPVPENRIQVVVGEGYAVAVDCLRCGDLDLLCAVVVRQIGIPGLVPVVLSNLMVVIVDVELYTVPCKRPGIFHHVLHTVHDNMSPHWNKGA